MLDYNLNNRGATSIYEYLYQCIRIDIESGTIGPDEHLPSKRTLAVHLGISVITVENAYAQLVAEGYVYTKPRSGYFASGLPQAKKGRSSAASKPAPAPRSNAPKPKQAAYKDLPAEDLEAPGIYEPSVAKFWNRALRNALTQESESELYAISPAQGILRLRQAIANHLRQMRGMEVSPENIVVGAGAQLLDIMLVQLLGANKRWALEDPGYLRLTNLYQAAGVKVSHIAMDAEGVSMHELTASRANVLHVMPSHQFPTGTVTSIARRYELLSWASAATGRYIIEDDYDCEFRLAGKPIPSLQSIDATGRVIYTNTFSKSLSSALRLAYMVLPDELMERYHKELGFYSSTLSTVQQVALARVLESGEYERHVNRVRKAARSRRDELVDLFELSIYASQVTIEAADAGLHFLVALAPDCGTREIQEFLADYDVIATPLSDFAWDAKHAQSPDGLTRLVVQL